MATRGPSPASSFTPSPLPPDAPPTLHSATAPAISPIRPSPSYPPLSPSAPPPTASSSAAAPVLLLHLQPRHRALDPNSPALPAPTPFSLLLPSSSSPGPDSPSLFHLVCLLESGTGGATPTVRHLLLRDWRMAVRPGAFPRRPDRPRLRRLGRRHGLLEDASTAVLAYDPAAGAARIVPAPPGCGDDWQLGEAGAGGYAARRVTESARGDPRPGGHRTGGPFLGCSLWRRVRTAGTSGRAGSRLCAARRRGR
ncbi:translation initiation factor IF-2-like [Phoenix dactylifera]|uniref:Translation initiation factor IF-2-like n=1 Tax=Phoenix dactylifera TaxID=42345 RepID=A0A8B9A0C0_PHODC|nr:translation initiation factor IF-2-like [Phoenix dactylifera]